MRVEQSKGLLGSWSLVAGLTTVSRVLGLAREIAFAWFIGAGVVMDAFIVAFRIPSLFRHFFAEGALSQSFVPVYSERMEAGDDREELGDLLGRVMGTLGAVVALVSLVGVIFAPIFVWLCAPGFALEGGESYEQAVTMLRLTFPYLFFISITAMLAAVLNAHRKFAAAAFTPVLMNICLIAAASLYAMQSGTAGRGAWLGRVRRGAGANDVPAVLRPVHLRSRSGRSGAGATQKCGESLS